MSEQDFWTKYFRSKHFYEDRLKGGTAGGPAMLFNNDEHDLDDVKGLCVCVCVCVRICG